MTNRQVILSAIIVALLAGLGLYYLITSTGPDPLTRPLFLLLLFLTATGISVPVAYYLNFRFATEAEWNVARPLRQSVWVALLIVLWVWLRMLRVLDLPSAALLLGMFALVEVFILTRR